MTMSQGPAIWEHFGHNALVVEDPSRGTSVAWNWGLFDFRQADFIPRFLKGEMMYWMDGFDASALAASYQRQGRTVWLDELALTQEQARELQRLVAINALPENRFYRYPFWTSWASRCSWGLGGMPPAPSGSRCSPPSTCGNASGR
jgi:hypothetical protein